MGNPGTFGMPPGGRSGRRVTGLIRAANLTQPSALTNAGARSYTFNIVTPGALTELLTIRGRGAVLLAGIQHGSANAQSIRARMTLDGVVLFDESSASAGSSQSGYIMVGAALGISTLLGQYIPFDKEVRFEASSNAPAGTLLYLFLLAEIHQ
jgi:hypothetical protein